MLGKCKQFNLISSLTHILSTDSFNHLFIVNTIGFIAVSFSLVM